MLTRRGYAPCELERLEGRQLLSTVGPDDKFEDNDLPVTVVRAPQGAANSPNLGVVSGQKIIRQLAMVDSGDYYRFRTSYAGTAADSVKLNFGNANGNLDMQLIGAGGKAVLRSSLGNSGTETISLNGLAAGTYFIKVFGKNGQTNSVYRLTFQGPTAPPPPPPPTDDAYEDNDTIVQVKARGTGDNSPNLGYFSARTVSGLILHDTYDIYSFTVSSTLGSNAFVKVNASVPMDMVLYNSAGTPIRSSEAYLGVFQINLAGLIADRYYVQVTHYALGTEGTFNYSLTFGA